MQKTFKTRLADLERLDRARHGHCRGYVILGADGEVIDDCPCGRVDGHKAYVQGSSPDEWDVDSA